MVKVIHWPWSKVTQFEHFQTYFTLETARPIEAKFHVEPQWDGGSKVCSNSPGRMTKIAVIPTYEPPRDKTNKLTCAPSEDSDQPGRIPRLIWVFAARSLGSSGPKLSSCGQRSLWSDWADAQADLNLRWAHMPFWWFCHEAAHMVKTWKSLLLWNQNANDLESLYVASDIRALPSLFKWWPWVDFDLFYGKVKVGLPCFCMGKS